MIWAMGKNREIGKDLEIPWHISEDFKYFKKTTMGKPVIMGLKTYESMGKALPGRRNIVLDFHPRDLPDAEIVTDITKIPEMFKDEEAFIIGGASIYKLFIDKVDKLFMTYINHEFDANIFFPEFDINKWKLVSVEKGTKDEKNPYDYYFRVYKKK